MANISDEQISALLDSEVGKHEQELILHRLLRDEATRGTWARYQLISDTLRNQVPERMDPGFAARVLSRLEASPVPALVAMGSDMRVAPLWRRPMVGFGLAASLALVAVVVMRGQGVPTEAGLAVAEQAQLRDLPTAAVTAPAPETASAQQDWQAKLNEYLVNHNEYASMASVPGVLPYVRMVGYDAGR